MALSGKKKIRNKNKNWGSADSGWHTVRPLSKAHFVIVLYFLHFFQSFPPWSLSDSQERQIRLTLQSKQSISSYIPSSVGYLL